MNKELEALEKLSDLANCGDLQFHERHNVWTRFEGVNKYKPVIEKALDVLYQLQMILGAETIEGLPDLALKIDNACYSVCYELKQAEKKVKAFDIIKKYIFVNKPFGTACYICLNDESEMIPEEEYELLKEVLL